MSVLMNTHTLQIFCSRNLPQITRLNNSPATENHLPLTPIISQSSLSRCVCVCVCVSDTWSGPVRGRSLGDWGRRTIKRPKFVLIRQKRLTRIALWNLAFRCSAVWCLFFRLRIRLSQTGYVTKLHRSVSLCVGHCEKDSALAAAHIDLLR